jgi:hypothetical protein
MERLCGKKALDERNREIGTVDQIRRSIFTGNLDIIVVCNRTSRHNLFFRVNDLLEINKDSVRLKVPYWKKCGRLSCN